MKFPTTILLGLAISATAAPIAAPIPSKTVLGRRQSTFDLGSFSSYYPSSGSSSSISSFGSLGSFDSLGSSTGSGTGSSLGFLGGTSTSASSTTKSSSSSATSATSSSSAASESSASDAATPSSTVLAEASGDCKAVTLLFARGTGETGTMGTIIGPPLAEALASALGEDKVSSEGVDYPASSAGNADLGATGGKAMASQATSILSSCPSTKLVLAGYSQGAMVVHNALSAQGLDGSKVAAIVAFGDPFNGQDFEGVDASKVKEFCGSADTLCSSGGTSGSGTSHISYGGDADEAAEFIAGVVGA